MSNTLPKPYFRNRNLLIGVLFYLVVFYAIQITSIPAHISWIELSGIVAVVTLIFVYLATRGNPQKKLLFALLSIILAFTISFAYSTIAYFKASDTCNQALNKNYQRLVGDNPTESNGFKKSWNLTENCADKLLPFPWGKQAAI